MSTSNSDDSSSSDDDVRRAARERLREACDPDWAAGSSTVRAPPAPKRARNGANDDLCVTDAVRDHVSQRLQQKLDR